MTQTTTSGSLLYVSAALPATANAAGYEALTWTAVGEIIDMGEVGETTNVVTSSNVSSGYVIKLVGLKDGGEQSLQLARDNADTGHDELISIYNTAAKIGSFKLVPQGMAETVYYTALVTSLKKPMGGAETVQTLNVTLARTPYKGVMDVVVPIV